MRRAMVMAVFLTSGCSSFFQDMTGHGVRLDTHDTYPHEVDYELLATTSAKACGASDSDAARQGHSTDPARNGPAALFEQAKFLAIASVPNADGLAAIRTEVNETNGSVCVTLTGRAYRITGLRAVAAHETTTRRAQAATGGSILPLRE